MLIHELIMARNGHHATATQNDIDIRVNCSCHGHWKHPTNTEEDTIIDIFHSHVAYAEREPMKTL